MPELTADERFWSKVEKTDGCWIWTASRRPDGYGQFRLNNHIVYAHRYSWEKVMGPAPSGFDLDHICRTRTCVNPDHLRVATRKQNSENLSGPPSTNASGFLGVPWEPGRDKWRGKVKHHGKAVLNKRYNTMEEAIEAVHQTRLKYFTHNELDRAA